MSLLLVTIASAYGRSSDARPRGALAGCRHLAVDILGLLLTVLVTAASVQDRGAAKAAAVESAADVPSVKILPRR